jgi:hypothetical protein
MRIDDYRTWFTTLRDKEKRLQMTHLYDVTFMGKFVE